MSTLRVSNIEAKADPSSPSVNEKVKITNSNGDVMLQLDGSTSGITTVGINTTTAAFTVDSAQNIQFVGIVTANSFSATEALSSPGMNVTGVVTATSFEGDGSSLTGIDATSLKDSGGNIKAQAEASGIVITGVVTASSSIEVGNSFVKATSIGIGTTTTTGRNAGIGTATGTVIYNSTTNLVEVYTPYGWDIVGKQTNVITATGGNTVDTSSRPGYKVHIFTGPGTFAVSGGFNDVEYLVVGGGGGAGGDVGGGAGAGGYRTGTFTVSPGNYPVFVGGGGNGHPFNTPGTNGIPSYFGSIVSEGGGYGGRGGSGPGGSGGGTPYNSATQWGYGINPSTPQPVLDPYSLTAPYPITQGNPGGTNPGGGSGGGGGGGAGAPGGNGSGPSGAAVGGAGGNGLPSSITGTSVTRAGGGAGGGYQAPGNSGGSGGGGPSGGNAPGNPGSAGQANTGGGGGSGSSNAGGAGGGSGIVIIAYPTS